jgi:tetratricopeptide (TPR) repeat protein
LCQKNTGSKITRHKRHVKRLVAIFSTNFTVASYGQLSIDASMSNPILERSIQLNERGDRTQAEKLCCEFLSSFPNDASGWSLLGLICLNTGRLQEAEKHCRHALQIRPNRAPELNNLGSALARQGRFSEAVACFKQVLDLEPTHKQARVNLGRALKDQARRPKPPGPEKKAADENRPSSGPAEDLNQRAVALAKRQQFVEAEALLRQALVLRPDFPEAHNNLGNVLAGRELHDQAAGCYRQAIQFRHEYFNAHNNLANALVALGRPEEAIVSYRQAIELRPDFVDAISNLGLTLAQQRRWLEAEKPLAEAFRLRPEAAEIRVHLSRVLLDLGRPEDAVAHLEHTLRITPMHVDAHWTLSLSLLLLGKWQQGWAEYEWRWRRRNAEKRPFRPLWDGRRLDGGTIVLHAEQGLGDTIQFIRYVKMVREWCPSARIVAYCPPPIIELLKSFQGIDELIPEGQPLPKFDFYSPLITLPAIFGTTIDNVPAEVPYLKADSDRVARWRSQLASETGFKVGIVWQGNPRHKRDAFRSAPLTAFAPLANVPGVRLYSLQKRHGMEQLAAIQGQFQVADLANTDDSPQGVFMDTAAILKNLDLLVTVDTAVAHLAGALGVPVWVALSTLPDWRWLLGREHTPWYPSMRLFRQKTYGDWSSVFEQMANELKNEIKSGNHG